MQSILTPSHKQTFSKVHVINVDIYLTMLFESELLNILNNSEEKLSDFDEETIIERFKNKFGEEEKKWYRKNKDSALDKTDGYITLNKGKLEIYVADQSGNMVLTGTLELKSPKLVLPADAAKIKP